MLIKPVYVVEPKDAPTTRRALLMAAAAGVAGMTIGCAAGVMIGKETTAAAAESNPRLVRAHYLATQADPHEMLTEAAFFLAVVQEQGHRQAIDATLWSGCCKLAEAVLKPDRQPAQTMDRVVGDALLSLKHYPHPDEFARWIPELDRFVRERRKK